MVQTLRVLTLVERELDEWQRPADIHAIAERQGRQRRRRPGLRCRLPRF